MLASTQQRNESTIGKENENTFNSKLTIITTSRTTSYKKWLYFKGNETIIIVIEKNGKSERARICVWRSLHTNHMGMFIDLKSYAVSAPTATMTTKIYNRKHKKLNNAHINWPIEMCKKKRQPNYTRHQLPH